MKSTFGIAALLTLSLAAVEVRAADEGQVLRQQAERLAATDRCDEAIERAREARALDPNQARAALVEGRCQLRAGEYAAALDAFRAARDLDPSLPGVHADIGQCHYHLGELDAAESEFERAEVSNPDDGRTQLYKGLILARRAESAEAAAAFDRAASLDANLADAASLYAGRTWAALREQEKAQAALERARAADPGSAWALEASRELEALKERTRRRAWLRIRAGIEYDTNVPLAADISVNSLSVRRLGPFADPEDDVRGIYEADAGVELLGDEDWSAGVSGGFRGNAHIDIGNERTDRFDLASPWGALWFDRRLGEDTWLRLQPFVGYTWLGYDPFVLYGGLNAEVSTRFTKKAGGRVFAVGSLNDFQSRVETSRGRAIQRARNRDGLGVEAGIEGDYTFAATETRVHLGTSYDRQQTEGRDWSYHGSRTWLGARQPLPWNSRFEVEGSLHYRDHDHRSSFLPLVTYAAGNGPKRRDHHWQVKTQLAHRMNEWLEVAVHWRFELQDSNTRVFDYDRHVVGGTFTLFFGDS